MENTNITSYQIAKVDVDIFHKTKFPRIVLLGRSNCGKSEAVKAICHSMRRQCYQAFVHSSSESNQKFYETFITSDQISFESNFDSLRTAYEEHKKRKQSYEAMVASKEITFDDAQKKCQMLMILDDVDSMGDNIFKNELIKQLWMNGRHDWITVLVTLQSAQGVGPMLRDQSDWVVTWYDPSVTNQKHLYMNWIGYFPSFRDFKDVYNDITGEYKCLIACKLCGGRTNVESNIFSWAPSRIEGSFSFISSKD